MSFLKGENRILSLKVSGVWTPIGCLEGNAFSETVELLPTTTRENNGWETAVPVNQSYTISFTGVVPQSSTGKVTLSDLRTYKRNRTLLDWKLEDVTTGMIDIGRGYLTNIGETADVGDFLAFDGEIVGYGVPVVYTDTTRPSRPVLTLSDQTATTISLSWTESTDDIGVVTYRIYRDGVLFDTVSAPTLTYDDVAIVHGDKYSYNVSALDSSGNESILSNKVISASVNNPTVTYLLLENGQPMLAQNNTPLLVE